MAPAIRTTAYPVRRTILEGTTINVAAAQIRQPRTGPNSEMLRATGSAFTA